MRPHEIVIAGVRLAIIWLIVGLSWTAWMWATEAIGRWYWGY